MRSQRGNMNIFYILKLDRHDFYFSFLIQEFEAILRNIRMCRSMEKSKRNVFFSIIFHQLLVCSLHFLEYLHTELHLIKIFKFEYLLIFIFFIHLTIPIPAPINIKCSYLLISSAHVPKIDLNYKINKHS